jgi:hypothetical protein
MTPAKAETRTDDGSVHIALSGPINLANAAAIEDKDQGCGSHHPNAVSVDRIAPGGAVVMLGMPSPIAIRRKDHPRGVDATVSDAVEAGARLERAPPITTMAATRSSSSPPDTAG